jgi:hypothetical protein
MRFLLKISMPHEPFNGYVKDGSCDGKMQSILNKLKPEAAYFAEMNGKRTGILIVNMTETSQMPSIAEPWFVTFGADIEFHPVMLPEDLAKSGLAEIGRSLR